MLELTDSLREMERKATDAEANLKRLQFNTAMSLLNPSKTVSTQGLEGDLKNSPTKSPRDPVSQSTRFQSSKQRKSLYETPQVRNPRVSRSEHRGTAATQRKARSPKVTPRFDSDKFNVGVSHVCQTC